MTLDVKDVTIVVINAETKNEKFSTHRKNTELRCLGAKILELLILFKFSK